MKNDLQEELFNDFIIQLMGFKTGAFNGFLKDTVFFNTVKDLLGEEVVLEQYEARAMKGTLRLLTTDDNFIVGVRGRPEGVHGQKILITVVEE